MLPVSGQCLAVYECVCLCAYLQLQELGGKSEEQSGGENFTILGLEGTSVCGSHSLNSVQLFWSQLLVW